MLFFGFTNHNEATFDFEPYNVIEQLLEAPIGLLLVWIANIVSVQMYCTIVA